ncbi:hypothetical protein DFH06DRAFT_1365996 [Mycena polygramma]|nr:hypothetical protein DFH06DRAFT_1365996 [Mycena polygramma]
MPPRKVQKRHRSKHDQTLRPTLPTGIRRLPTELLVEIFTQCWNSFTPDFDDIDVVSASFATEIERLAHAPLLDLSRVCSKWHAIALNTPSLWCDVQLDGVLWGPTLDHIRKAKKLLQVILRRGDALPLSVALSKYGPNPFPPSVIQLLAAHSQRWHTLICPLSLIIAFSAVKGKLPRLHFLDIDVWEEDSEGIDESQALDILDPAPNLKYLHLPVSLPASMQTKLPLEQLRGLEYRDIESDEISDALSSMARLPIGAEFRLELFLWSEEPESLYVGIPHLTSKISTLYIELLEDFEPVHAQIALGCIFANITLPLLQDFELESLEYPRLPIAWPHAEFLALSARSAFDTHLVALEIYEVNLTEAQLLECLAGLPALERLAISDHQPIKYEGADQILITDTLFSKLSRTDCTCLVPRLNSLGCQTLLKFDDEALLTLVLSRLEDTFGSGSAGRFELELSWLPGHCRSIAENVLARFGELRICTRRRFEFRITEAEKEWIHCVEDGY